MRRRTTQRTSFGLVAGSFHDALFRAGVIAIDNILVSHRGEMIEDVGWSWDHVDRRHLMAHDYVIAWKKVSILKHESRRSRILPPTGLKGWQWMSAGK